MHRNYTLLWRKTWANPILSEPEAKFKRLPAWLHLTNAVAAGVDDPASRIRCREFRACVRRRGS